MTTEKPVLGKRRPKGIYLLPNLLTTSSLFAGFYAIVAGMRGDFENASIAIFIAMIMDGLDGRVARLTNTQSAFGAEYDSLADLVSFGIAPSLVAYCWGLMSLGKLGWLIAFIFTAATALRLARFNSRIHTQDKRFFQGLPCPSAAGLIAALIWAAQDYGFPNKEMIAAISFLTGMLMVSSIPYYSFKDIDFKGHVPFMAVVAFLVLMVGVSLAPSAMLLFGFSVFVLSGPSHMLWRLKTNWQRRRLLRKKQNHG